MRLRPSGLACVLLSLPLWSLAAQRAVLSGVVVAEDTREPLAYSVVAIPALGREQFTNDSGAFVFGDVPFGSFTLKVRRLGFLPADITLDFTGVGPIRLALTRVAVKLGSVLVRAYPPCAQPGPPSVAGDTLLATVFSQLRMNADQLQLLSKEYPFISQMDAVLARKPVNGQLYVASRTPMAVDSRKQWRYRPGTVVTYRGRDYIFNIPNLIQFADQRFLDEHCFHYAGVDTVRDLPVLRLDMVAADRLADPDVNGSLYIDPGSFQIRRSILRLSQTPRIRGLGSWEVTTDFDEVMQSVPVISRIFSVQSFDTTRRRDYDAVYEEWLLKGVKFLGKKPGEERKVP